MDPERHARLEECFHRARTMAPAERREYLVRECADDPALRREVEALLDADDAPDEILQETALTALDEEPQPESIGPYRVFAKLGEGGFASVYAAEQREPVRRRVAVKVLKPGLDSRAVLARFEAERQALALMNHPSIARVFDAGQTHGGRPYFVMELVDGVNVVEYCNRHRLGLRERVSLMVTVCQAVQHAHQKGIIHRDLKPSNVLVTTVDGAPLPKIIDFGIAKATGFQLGTHTVFTHQGLFLGTPEYSSPEQADPGSVDIDTRSDVYSLGVLAYELLTGELPFPRQSLLKAGLAEVMRILREVDPPRPSTRVSASHDRKEGAIPNLQMDRRTLSRRLKGDLDWIVMRALEKDRVRRYDTAYSLADDFQRFLRGDPVAAGPPTLSYRAGKFLSRHRVPALAGALCVLLLLGFATTMAVQARRIAVARDRAELEARTSERVSGFLSSLFEFSDPDNARGRNVSARELLDSGSQRLKEELRDEPLVRASLLVTMGRVYRRLDERELAAKFLEEAVAIRESELGADHLETVYARTSLGIVYAALGRNADAESLLERCVADQRRLLGEDHRNTQRAASALADVYLERGQVAQAIPLYEAILATRRRVLGPDDRDTLYAMYNLAAAFIRSGRDDLAYPLVQESLAKLRVVRGDDHPNTLAIIATLGELEARRGQPARAAVLLEEALAGQEVVHGAGSDEAAATRAALEQVRIGKTPE